MDPDVSRRSLPVLGQPPPERTDAARNRRRILSAAENIVAVRGACGLTMNEVAAAAGVGVGTVYRRFGDLSGLVAAVTDTGERRFQRAFITGPPPLGPGAPPRRRITAFLHAYVDRLETSADLLSIGESATQDGRYRIGAYAVHHRHLANLIAEADPGADAHYLADALLASLSAGLFIRHRREYGMSIERIKTGLDRLVTGLLG
jgi:AcrR family transcriptional regulator